MEKELTIRDAFKSLEDIYEGVERIIESKQTTKYINKEALKEDKDIDKKEQCNEECLNEDYIYLFPDEPAMGDFKKECKYFKLNYLGKNEFEDGDDYVEHNLVIKGSLKALKDYADFLGYDLHPDYLYKADEFAGDIIEEKCELKEAAEKDEIWLYVADKDDINKALKLNIGNDKNPEGYHELTTDFNKLQFDVDKFLLAGDKGDVKRLIAAEEYVRESNNPRLSGTAKLGKKFALAVYENGLKHFYEPKDVQELSEYQIQRIYDVIDLEADEEIEKATYNPTRRTLELKLVGKEEPKIIRTVRDKYNYDNKEKTDNFQLGYKYVNYILNGFDFELVPQYVNAKHQDKEYTKEVEKEEEVQVEEKLKLDRKQCKKLKKYVEDLNNQHIRTAYYVKDKNLIEALCRDSSTKEISTYTIELDNNLIEDINFINSLLTKKLNEGENFNLMDKEDVEKAKEVLDEPKSEGEEVIIDVNAQEVDKLKDSYLGNVVLQCKTCNSLMFEEPELLVKDENGELYNTETECPHCGAKSGYELVGQIGKLGTQEQKEEEPVEEVKEEEKVELDDSNMKVEKEEEVQVEESLKEQQ